MCGPAVSETPSHQFIYLFRFFPFFRFIIRIYTFDRIDIRPEKKKSKSVKNAIVGNRDWWDSLKNKNIFITSCTSFGTRDKSRGENLEELITRKRNGRGDDEEKKKINKKMIIRKPYIARLSSLRDSKFFPNDTDRMPVSDRLVNTIKICLRDCSREISSEISHSRTVACLIFLFSFISTFFFRSSTLYVYRVEFRGPATRAKVEDRRPKPPPSSSCSAPFHPWRIAG